MFQVDQVESVLGGFPGLCPFWIPTVQKTVKLAARPIFFFFSSIRAVRPDPSVGAGRRKRPPAMSNGKARKKKTCKHMRKVLTREMFRNASANILIISVTILRLFCHSIS